MKFKQPPLKINCEGLSRKLIADLADRLAWHFENVKTWDDEIEVSKPLNDEHYSIGWKVIDKFGVQAV